VNFKRHGLAALRRDQRRGVLPGDACQARGRFGWDPSGAVCGAATLDRQHGMAAPLSGRQPELIPTAYLSTSDGDRKADRAHRQASAGTGLSRISRTTQA
jgi:hypothetical protein